MNFETVAITLILKYFPDLLRIVSYKDCYINMSLVTATMVKSLKNAVVSSRLKEAARC